MATSRMTPDACARVVMETVPMVMHFIRTQMRRHRAPSLSVPQLRTLAFVHSNPGTCLFSVADHLGVTRPTASAMVDRLVRRGLLHREADPRERRRIVLTLTPQGSRHLEQARRATRLWMARALASVPAPGRRRIAEGVGLLGSAFRKAVGTDGA